LITLVVTRIGVALLLAIAAAAASAAGPACLAQGSTSGGARVPDSTERAAPGAERSVRDGMAAPVSVAVFDLAFYGAHANSIEPGDSALAGVTTAALRGHVASLPGVVLIDTTALQAAAHAPGPRDSAGGHPCNVVVACARAAARTVHARWAVTGTLSKTSNLIWIYSGQLIDVETGAIALDDEYELKGNSRDMAPQGARVFTERIAKKLGIPAARDIAR